MHRKILLVIPLKNLLKNQYIVLLQRNYNICVISLEYGQCIILQTERSNDLLLKNFPCIQNLLELLKCRAILLVFDLIICSFRLSALQFYMSSALKSPNNVLQDQQTIQTFIHALCFMLLQNNYQLCYFNIQEYKTHYFHVCTLFFIFFCINFFFWLSHVQISLCIFSSATQIWLLSQIQMEALYLMFCQNCPRNSKVEISLGFGKDAFTTVSTLFRLLQILLSFLTMLHCNTLLPY